MRREGEGVDGRAQFALVEVVVELVGRRQRGAVDRFKRGQRGAQRGGLALEGRRRKVGQAGVVATVAQVAGQQRVVLQLAFPVGFEERVQARGGGVGGRLRAVGRRGLVGSGQGGG